MNKDRTTTTGIQDGINPRFASDRLHSSLWVTRFEKMSRVASIIVIAITAVVLLGGYVMEVHQLRNLASGLPKMMPNTAFGLMLAALAFLFYTTRSKKEVWYRSLWLPRLIAGVVFILGTTTGLEYILDINLGIDELLFPDTSPEATFPGRPSPQTSLGFVLAGISLILLGNKRAWVLRFSQLLAVVVGFVAVVAVIGYVYHALPFYSITAYTGMAIHTAVCFLLISIGIIFFSSDRGLAAIFCSHSEGGHMARRLLPAIIAIPIILGVLTKTGERFELFSSEIGMAMDVTLHIVLLGAELWLFSLFLDRSNIVRDSAINTMKQHASQLEASNLELQALSTGIPHNLAPSLKNISSNVDSLFENRINHLDEKGKTNLKSIRESVDNIGFLVDDLLKLSQVSDAGLSLNSVSLSDMAETILDDFSKKHPENNIDYAVTPGLRVKGDASLLRIALENLLENAWKFSCNVSAPKIEVDAFEDNGVNTFFIRDNGVGFDMSKSDKLFQPFQRCHQANEYPGTGIGLAIVQRIIHRHGGRVWVDSKINQGTTVYFILG